MIADISSGTTGFADVCFLIALILFAIATVWRALRDSPPYDGVLIAAGLAAVALGWLVL
jgi:hypothetical protein